MKKHQTGDFIAHASISQGGKIHIPKKVLKMIKAEEQDHIGFYYLNNTSVAIHKIPPSTLKIFKDVGLVKKDPK